MDPIVNVTNILSTIRRKPAVLLVPGALFILAGWEIASRSSLIDSRKWSSPIAIAGTIGKDLVKPADSPDAKIGTPSSRKALIFHVGYTLCRFAAGFGIAAIIGVAVGFMLGVSRTLDALGRPIVDMLRSLPSAAVWPLCVMILGLRLQSQLFVTVFGAVWPILINTREGVSGLEPEIHDALDFMKMGCLRRYSAIFWWASWGVFSGLEIGCGVAFLLTVTTEFFLPSQNGIGWYIDYYMQPSPDADRIFAALTVIALIGLGLSVILNMVKKRLIFWKHPDQSTEKEGPWKTGRRGKRLISKVIDKRRAILEADRVTWEIQKQYGIAAVRPTILYQGDPYMFPREIDSRLSVANNKHSIIQRDITIETPANKDHTPETVLFARSWILLDRLSARSVNMLHERELTIGEIVFNAEENPNNINLGYRERISEKLAVPFGINGTIRAIQRGRIISVRGRPAILIHEFVRVE